MKNKLFALAIILPSLAFTSGCSGASKKEEDPGYTKDTYQFKTLYKESTYRKLNIYNTEKPKENGYTTFRIDKDIGSNAFLKIDLETDVNLVGYIYYHNVDNPLQTNKEKFFVEASQTTYQTFLDSFRLGAFAKYNKILDKITLQSVDSTKEGTIKVKEIGISNRTYDPWKMLYISDDTSELGLSLSFGGAIQSYKRKDADVVEYITDDGFVKIDRDIDVDQVTVISEDVNFINVYDLGREVQLSYYWCVDETNGYYPTSDKKYPGVLRYNPIQCGSAGDIYPQIIDYQYSKDCLYIKAYGQDWFLENSIDPTYYEVTYTMRGNGLVVCDTKTTNFGQFTGLQDIPANGQEAPAFYVDQPLNYFYCETTDGIIFDENVSKDMTNTARTSLKENPSGDYYWYLNKKKVTNHWAAWVNENMFGIGLYNPMAENFDGCRYTHTTLYNDTNGQNNSVKASMYDELSSPHGYNPSCYVSNANYIGATLIAAPQDFIPLYMSYAIFAGDVEEMGEVFGALEETQELYHEQTWPNK